MLYAFLTLAVSTGQMLAGGLLLALFGLGTVPVMTLTGCAGSLLALRHRRRAFLVASWCVVVTGLITIARAAGLFGDQYVCPFCIVGGG